MKRSTCRNLSWSSSVFILLLTGLACSLLSCGKSREQVRSAPSRPSDIKVQVQTGGPVVLTTTTAEFQILPSGFVKATLLKDGKRLSLDEPGVGTSAVSGYLIHEGKDLLFTPDFSQAKVSEASGKLGRGKLVEIPARPLLPSGTAIERTVAVEVYDDFPAVAFVSATYKNAGTSDFHIDQAIEQQHRFSARQVAAKAQPYDMWSFQGSS